MTPKVVMFVSATLLAFCLSAIAQERHLQSGAAAAGLFGQSAFAHGYIHGYEDGFHSGDIELQFGRDARDPAAHVLYKRSLTEYRSRFGSKALFKSGFENGFRVGYSEAMRGLPFHAIAELRQAAEGLQPDAQWAAVFDRGFHEGYQSGRRGGTHDGRERSAFQPIYPPCLGLPEAYCDAFGRGFGLGYEDGYRNQTDERVFTDKLQASAGK